MGSIIRVLRKFGGILSRHQKIRILELCILMLVGGILETFSVSLMVPYMNTIISPDEMMGKWYVRMICELLAIDDVTVFLAVFSLLLAFLFVLKNAYLIFEFNIQYRFVYSNMFVMQKKLLESFLLRPYEYFLHADSGEIIRIINEDTTNAFNLLIQLLGFFTELIVSAMLIGAIFVIDPAVTLGMGVFLLLLLALIQSVIKPVLRSAGLSQHNAGASMNKWMIQSIQGIKELKVMQKEEYFKGVYEKNGNVYIQSLRRYQILTLVPRFLIEGVSMAAMLIVISFFILRGIDLQTLIPVIAAIVMGAMRLLPSVNRISASLSAVAYGEPMLDKVIENYNEIDKQASSNQIQTKKVQHVPQFNERIELNNISFHYPESERKVLNDASMYIKKGESIGVIGASGEGKTTSIDVLMGLLNPQGGTISIDGVNIKDNMEEWIAQVGYIPQSIFLLDDTIEANIAFGEEDGQIDADRVEEVIDAASLRQFINSLPDGKKTKVGERGVRLSGGQKQRIGIARALYRNTNILVFDEATSSLDNKTESDIMESIYNLKGEKTMIIIAHRLSTIEMCDRVYKVEDGKIEEKRNAAGRR